MTVSAKPDLYQDVLEHTFSYLTGPELASASAVSRVWNQTAKELWPSFLMRDFGPQKLDSAQKEYSIRFQAERNFGYHRMKIDDKITILYSLRTPLSPCNKKMWGAIRVKMAIV